MARRRKILRRRVLRINQNSEHPLYLFSLSGKDLLSIADISRISRTSTGKLIGYQRPAVKRHVKDIVDYLNSDKVIFPSSIILSLSSDVRFVRSRGPNVEDDAVTAVNSSITMAVVEGEGIAGERSYPHDAGVMGEV